MSGVKSEGWPEPSLLGSRALVDVASRAQRERLQDYDFWQGVAERAIQLRDVMDVSDLAVVLDTLLTANHRHTHLMKTVSREVIDDVDKLSLVETAVIANAYAQFSCVSKPLLSSLSQHARRLLEGQTYTTVDNSDRYGLHTGDLKTLAVLCKAFAKVQHKDPELLKAVNTAMVETVQDADFNSISELVSVFADLGEPFEAPEQFWSAVVAKVPGSRMTFLCPLLRAASKLGVEHLNLYEALGSEILKGLTSAPSTEPLEAKRVEKRFPAFANPSLMPAEMLAPIAPTLTVPPAVSPQASSALLEESTEDVVEFDQAFTAFQGAQPVDDVEVIDDQEQSFTSRRRRWYNAVSRRLDGMADSAAPKVPYYVNFSADENYARNLRGARVAEAIEGFDALEQVSKSSSSTSSGPGSAKDEGQPIGLSLDQELLNLAGPVLCAAMQGLSTSQLATCAEIFASKGHKAVVSTILRESVRRLSNFSIADLRKLHAASQSAGISDPYLERARYRRFPKALRKELRDSGPGA